MTPRTVGKRRHFHPADCGPLYFLAGTLLCAGIGLGIFYVASGLLYATGVWR